MHGATSSTRSPYVPLLLGVACVSSGSILVRLAQAPPLAVSFRRVFLASLLLTPLALRPLLRGLPRLRSGQRLALVGCGIALAVHFATWIASLSYTSVASSVLLVNTAPLFSIAFSRLFLRESVPRTVALATVLALAGAALVAAGDWGQGAHSLPGDVLAVAGAVALSAYHVIGRGLRGSLPLHAYVLAVWGGSAATLALMAVSTGVPLWDYPLDPEPWFVYAPFPKLGFDLVFGTLVAIMTSRCPRVGVNNLAALHRAGTSSDSVTNRRLVLPPAAPCP